MQPIGKNNNIDKRNVLRMMSRDSIMEDAKESRKRNIQHEELLAAQKYSEELSGNIEAAFIVKLKEQSMKSICSVTGVLELFESIDRTNSNRFRCLETRIGGKSQQSGETFECLVIGKLNDEHEFYRLLTKLRTLDCVCSAEELPLDKMRDKKDVWMPRHISDLDKCRHLLTKFEPELQTDHPGFSDQDYRERRKEIAKSAFAYYYGTPIPKIEYNILEKQTWKEAYNELTKLYETMACKEHLDGLKLLQENCGYGPDNIPQLETISNYLHRRCGFRLRPAAGLISPRDFLASLAFRVFQCTQYVRHHTQPLHTPEPDCIHELLGHMPMLTNVEFAEFSQAIGLASIGTSDSDIERLATLYWFTVEFGLCKQDNELKAYGAGLLSAFGELKHALGPEPEKRPFNAHLTAITPYQDITYQPVYFVCESIQDMKYQLRAFDVTYDPYTETILLLNEEDSINKIVRWITNEVQTLSNSIKFNH